MTQVNVFDQRIIYFGIVFMAIVGVFVTLFTLDPITVPADPSSKVSVATVPSSYGSTLAPDWLANLIALPYPFADLVLLVALFITPVIIMLAFVGIRVIRDFLSL